MTTVITCKQVLCPRCDHRFTVQVDQVEIVATYPITEPLVPNAWPPASPELKALIEEAKSHVMTPEEIKEQRLSFAAGNIAMSTGEDVEVVKERMRNMQERMGL